MRIEDWRAYWMKVDKAPLKTPITWECKHCAYPGVVTRRCDVPSFCPYCGVKLPGTQVDAMERNVSSQRDAAESDALRAWYAGFQFSRAS